jgi:hypothetical protein
VEGMDAGEEWREGEKGSDHYSITPLPRV